MIVNVNLALKAGLAALFFLCLLDMPYGYYTLVRYLAMCEFVYLALQSKGNENLMLIYLALAILFQPIIKLPCGREIWNIIDVIVGMGLLFSIYRERTTSN